MSLLNERGQLIKRWVSNEQEKGEHLIFLDAEHLSSGTYFYQMKTEAVVMTKKMQVMNGN